MTTIEILDTLWDVMERHTNEIIDLQDLAHTPLECSAPAQTQNMTNSERDLLQARILELQKECDILKRHNERLFPVVLAATRWRKRPWLGELLKELTDAIDLCALEMEKGLSNNGQT